MKKKFIALIGAVSLLAACETASQKVVGGSVTSSANKSSLFGKTKETAADKLIAVGDRVLFGYDSAKLDESSKILIDAQSRFLRVNNDLNFVIEGHADERGTREYNLALGEQRATAVRDYLVIQGIDPDRIKVISYGKEKPAVVGSNNMAWSKNRRAVTVIN
jgi:peptidoglycan-associated lipoprotein